MMRTNLKSAMRESVSAMMRGESRTTVAKRFNVPLSYVSAWAAGFGIPKNSRARKPTDLDREIYRRWNAGESYRKLASSLLVTRSRISQSVLACRRWDGLNSESQQ